MGSCWSYFTSCVSADEPEINQVISDAGVVTSIICPSCSAIIQGVVKASQDAVIAVGNSTTKQNTTTIK